MKNQSKNQVISQVSINKQCVLLLSGLLVFVAQAQASEGLWVGSVEVDAVSEVNKPRSDLSFDLQLEGTLLDEDLVEAQSAGWTYDDTGVNHGTGWRVSGFSETGWKSGWGPFGYPVDASVNTEVFFGDDSDDKHPTTYFRRKFDIGDASIYTGLLLRYRRDDAIAIYINDQLVLKENLSAAVVSYGDLALSPITTDETSYRELTIPADVLINGENQLAVEIHIASADDDDMGFDLSLVGQREDALLIGARADDWAYHDDGGAALLPSQWRDIDYDEPGWHNGPASLGYGDGIDNDDETVNDQTIICSEPRLAGVCPSSPTLAQRNRVSYFRKQVWVSDASLWTHLKFSLLRDDGAVVYLNGVEVMRSNMPSGVIDIDSLPVEGVSGDDETRYYQQTVASTLIDGWNAIAVQVHQHVAELSPYDGIAPPSATPLPLSLRLLLHEDSNGDVRLLKQVIQMWKDGTLNPDGTVNTQGHYVLLTDDTLISQYKGVGVRGSSLVGRRISAVGFDFDGEQTLLDGDGSGTGTLDINQEVSGSFSLPGDHPTHPRRHRYHPEHDNSAPASEVATIVRTITLEISPDYPPDPDEPPSTPPPDWGVDRIGGVYSEVITGLHRDPIEVKGIFTLSRVSDRGSLNE